MSTTTLAVDLYRQLASTPGNLLVSPHSVWMALAMLLPGARGRTHQQLALGLGVADIAAVAEVTRELAKRSEPTQWQRDAVARGWTKDDGGFGFHLQSANKLWIQRGYPIHTAYAQALATGFGVDPQAVDFQGAPDAACAAINRWVSDQTHGLIPTIVDAPALIANVRALLANAVYFKAAWADEFHERATAPKPFRLLDGTTAHVPTMRRTAALAHGEDADAVAVAVPYINPDVAMIAIVPRDFDRFEPTAARLAGILAGLTPKQVDLELPRFKFENSLSIAAALRAVGFDDVLSPRADLSGISSEEGFHIGEVLHKTFIKVDEKGTEAAAVTAMMFAGAGPPPKPVVVKVDRPFYVIIRDAPTNTIFFFGRVVDPR